MNLFHTVVFIDNDDCRIPFARRVFRHESVRDHQHDIADRCKTRAGPFKHTVRSTFTRIYNSQPRTVIAFTT